MADNRVNVKYQNFGQPTRTHPMALDIQVDKLLGWH